MTDSNSAHTWRFRLPNSMEAVGKAQRSLEAFLEDQGVAPEVAFSVTLALEEAATNVIKYAYEDSKPHEVVLEAEIGPEEIAFRVIDDGREFNPLESAKPDLDRPHEERKVGGLGIHLLRSLAQRVDYERIRGTNRITLFFTLQP